MDFWAKVMEEVRKEADKYFDGDMLDMDEKSKVIKEGLETELPKVIPELIADDVVPTIVEASRSCMQLGFLKGIELFVKCMDKVVTKMEENK